MEMIATADLLPDHFELVADWPWKAEINRWLAAE
jgi:hypothetical protein